MKVLLSREEMNMKKRLISILLLLCLVTAVLPLQAFAAVDYSPYVTEVTINRGDTISALCRARGMNYESVKKAILLLNGYAKEASLNAVKVGQKIVLPVSAEAAKTVVALYETYGPADSVQYTVKQGDTLFSICTALHLNYAACKDTIKKLNNWESDKDLSNIRVGQKIYLPLNNTVVSSPVNTATPVAGTTTVPTVPSQTTPATVSRSGDKLVYYVVSHQMNRGETVNGVCDALGAKYSPDVSNVVKALNNLTNLSAVQAGKTYLFPSTSSAGASYAIYAHTIADGDTTGNLCTAYGVNYETVKDLLSRLNPKMKLTSIPKGGTIYLIGPVSSSAPVTPSNQGNTTPATNVLPASFVGNYAEHSVGRGVISITGSPSLYVVNVSWSDSAAIKVNWTFQGVFTANGLLQYNNCTKTTTQFNADGSSIKAVNYQNGTGYLYYVNGVLYWMDNQENVADGTYFVKY